MKKVFVVLIFVLCSFSFGKSMRQSIDWAIFQSDDNPIVELYYSLNQNDLTFTESQDGYSALFVTQLVIKKDDTVVQNFAFKSQRTVRDTAFIQESDVILDQLRFSLEPGMYNSEFFIQDLHSQEISDTTLFEIKVPTTLDQPTFSDIELAGSIRKADESSVESRFYKNTLLVEPNPSLMYSVKMPMLFFYAEIYNLPAALKEKPYIFSYMVTDRAGNSVDNIAVKNKKRTKSVENQVEYGFVNISKLPAGIYNLVLQIVQNDKVVTAKTKEFIMYREDIVAQQQGNEFGSSVFAFMDSTGVAKEYEYIFYLLSKEEREIYNNVNQLEQKRQYLFDFWHRKNPKIPVKSNPLRIEYLRRIDYANSNFRAYKKEGWRTDRGRVYIVYGKPNELDRHPSQANGAPWEEWRYHNMQGGVSFIFADLDDWNDYQLVHSDLYGEIQNRSYMDIIERGNY